METGYSESFGTSVHGDNSAPAQHGPGQPVTADPAQVRWLDKMLSRCPFQPQLFHEIDTDM